MHWVSNNICKLFFSFSMFGKSKRGVQKCWTNVYFVSNNSSIVYFVQNNFARLCAIRIWQQKFASFFFGKSPYFSNLTMFYQNRKNVNFLLWDYLKLRGKKEN